MNIAQHVQSAIDDYEHGKLLSALLHGCIAVDGTGARLLPAAAVRERFVATVDRYLWLVEPMLAVDINLQDTTFTWVQLKQRDPRCSEILYEVFRNNLAHGTEIPAGFAIELRQHVGWRALSLGPQQLVLPDTVIFALLAVAVFSEANAGQSIGAVYHLSHGSQEFVIDEWWGRESDARTYFDQVRLPRVTMQF